jgi:hypothetical protein
MPYSRMSNRNIFRNADLLYDEKFKQKDLKYINQYNTGTIRFPSVEQLMDITFDTRIWKVGDRLHKVAYNSYGDSRYWWVIAQFNKKPTDHHFKLGDTYYVPLNLEDALSAFGY